MKIVCILVGGFVLFRDPVSYEQFLGMSLSLTGKNLKFMFMGNLFCFLFLKKGVILYSIFTNRNNAKKAADKAQPLLPVLSNNDTKS